MLSLIAAAVCLIGSVLTQTPPSYTLAVTNQTLGLSYGSVSVEAGETLPYKVPSTTPTLSSTLGLNETYIAIIVDTTANLSSPIPADLVWFQQDVTFSSAGIGSANTSAQVPYVAPSSVGHAYLALLYTQPPGFIIPSNFPYNDTFRVAFNVSRVAVDFHSPLLAANWFVLGSNCSAPSHTASSGYGYGASTGFASGTHGPWAKKTGAVYANGAAGRY
ncbi:hypothetical protein HO173_003360 [Letharia columbiana]|uniref:Uncharacterized protein n=1 Tax=Letharia columbiana TaxID=112416 RepID=A0A8H6G0Y8_9LECA|nr:uncharacterized protein HO173_009982 [Letharia columbiana]XP_037167695.1 uncharacterized protein HO173_003360 [Letharia columbiana]KAF6231680.1 hypothetical protein HO173_009982 [Letharia columbiana]KAF6238393.1 hypothetical protein HO173_003360 [Letharia columbiana]